MLDPKWVDLPPSAAHPTYPCPHCGGALEGAPGEVAQVLQCPYCQQPFILPAADGSTLPVAQAVESQEVEEKRDDLDGLRIRNISLLRRTAYRGRSYCLIGMILCSAAGVQLLVRAGGAMWRWGQPLYAVAYGLGAILAGVVAVRFYRRAAAYGQEARQSALSNPSAPPDFTSLQDGSQHWKSLM